MFAVIIFSVISPHKTSVNINNLLFSILKLWLVQNILNDRKTKTSQLIDYKLLKVETSMLVGLPVISANKIDILIQNNTL